MAHLITNVLVVDGDGARPEPADVRLEGGTIVEILPAGGAANRAGRPTAPDTVLDGRGRLLMPGFVDAHAHTDGRLFDPEVQLALLRQGVTTVIGGQDGVS